MTKTARFEGFGVSERNHIACALRVAIEVYCKDEITCGVTAGHERMAEDFKRMKEKCESLLEEIENA